MRAPIRISSGILYAVYLISTSVQASLIRAAEPIPHVELSPFLAPASPNPQYSLLRSIFARQQGDCLSGFTTCAPLSAPQACCPSGTVCARDQGGNIACCPVNNYCTGTLGGGSQPSQTSGNGGGGGAVGTVTVTSTAGVTGSPSTITTAPQQSFTLTAGTVQNEYYPFPIIQTAFPNVEACSQAYTYCQVQSTSCFQALGGSNPVTISNMMGGGGVTQTGGSGAGGQVQPSASAICSSLYARGCYGLEQGYCGQLGASGAARPRETGRAKIGGYAAMGVAGVVGLVL